MAPEQSDISKEGHSRKSPSLLASQLSDMSVLLQIKRRVFHIAADE